ncbi:hypothetical protein D3C79_865970 [compost metagenome]
MQTGVHQHQIAAAGVSAGSIEQFDRIAAYPRPHHPQHRAADLGHCRQPCSHVGLNIVTGNQQQLIPWVLGHFHDTHHAALQRHQIITTANEDRHQWLLGVQVVNPGEHRQRIRFDAMRDPHPLKVRSNDARAVLGNRFQR